MQVLRAWKCSTYSQSVTLTPSYEICSSNIHVKWFALLNSFVESAETKSFVTIPLRMFARLCPSTSRWVYLDSIFEFFEIFFHISRWYDRSELCLSFRGELADAKPACSLCTFFWPLQPSMASVFLCWITLQTSKMNNDLWHYGFFKWIAGNLANSVMSNITYKVTLQDRHPFRPLLKYAPIWCDTIHHGCAMDTLTKYI